MKIIKSIIVWSLSLSLLSAAHGQVVTLEEVLTAIDRHHPMLQASDEKQKALNAYTEGAKNWMAPMVGVGTFMTPYPGQSVMEQRDKGSVMFSFEQEIPNPAKLNASRKYWTSKSLIEKQERSYQYNMLRAEARTLYYQWLVAEQKNNQLQESERVLMLMIKLAKVRYPYNQASLGSIYKVEGRVAEVQNMALMIQGDMDEKQSRLKALMNMPYDALIRVDTTTKIVFDVNGMASDTALLTAQRSDVHRIDQAILTMRLNQQLQRYQARPDFKIKFDHMQPLGDMPVQFTAMAMVSIPIAPWASRMYKSEIKGMQFDIAAMKREREALLLESRGMVAGMAARLQRMQQQLDNYQTKIIPALQKNYEATMLAYEENREQLSNVLDGWEALSMVRQERLDKLEEYYTMIASYEKQREK